MKAVLIFVLIALVVGQHVASAKSCNGGSTTARSVVVPNSGAGVIDARNRPSGDAPIDTGVEVIDLTRNGN